MFGVRLAAPIVGSLAVWLVFASAGCRDDEPTAPAQPTRVQVGPVVDGGGTPDPRVARPSPVAMWTLPPGDGPGITLSGTPVSPVGNVAVGPRTAPVAPLGGIPVPSPYPEIELADSGPPPVDPDIAALVAAVEPRRLSGDVRRLAGFGTRHTLSDTESESRGIGAARAWLFERFVDLGDAGPGQVEVEFEDLRASAGGTSSTQRNVIATLPGIGQRKRLIYVVGHYDSRAEDAMDGEADAPGANDNASGTAVLLELGRVLSSRQWDATVRLAALAAKETGMHGSRHHAAGARKLALPIAAVLNNDIVGASRGPDGEAATDRLRAFSEGPDDAPSRALARYVAAIGERYGLLDVEVVAAGDRPGGEGDHQSFSEAGFAALRLTEANEDPARQNSGRDTADGVDAGYLADVTRLNLAVVANLALAPPPPGAAPSVDLAAGRPDTVRLTWDPVDDPLVAGYWVAVREAGQGRYERFEWAGPATEIVLGSLTPDADYRFAVASSDSRGHLSLFSPEVAR